MNYTGEDIEQMERNVRDQKGDYLEDLAALAELAASCVANH